MEKQIFGQISITQVFSNAQITVYEVEFFGELVTVSIDVKGNTNALYCASMIEFKIGLEHIEKEIAALVRIFHTSSLNKTEADNG